MAVTRVGELIETIRRFIDLNPKLFVWTATGEPILGEVRKANATCALRH